jgi:hypothetical protein
MSDGHDDLPDQRRRHDDAVRSQASSPASRAVVDEQIKMRLREIGINLNNEQDVDVLRRALDLLRDLQKRADDVYGTLDLGKRLREEKTRLALDWLRDRYDDRERISAASAYATKMKARESEIDGALTFIEELKLAGKAGKKNILAIVVAAISSAVAGAIGAMFAARGH